MDEQAQDKPDGPKFIIRGPREEDINFIYKTWLENYRYCSYAGKSHRNSIFFEQYKLVIDHILDCAHCEVFVACIFENPDIILGYLVGEPSKSILHYIYIKEAFQRLGIASGLFEAAFNSKLRLVRFTHHTFELKEKNIIRRHPNLIHDQTLLMKKGEI